MGYYRAAQRHGAQFLFDTEVVDLTVEGGRMRRVITSRGEISAQTVLIAAGPWSDQLGRMVGLDIPLTPCPNQIHITEPVPWRILPPFLLISSKAICRQSKRGHVYTGNTNAPGGYSSLEKTTNYDEMLQTATYISKIVPPLKSLKYIRGWVGIIDFTPDDNFIFGHVDEVEGVVLACGFSGHGFALTPIIGQLLAELIHDGKTSLPTEAFRCNRFKEGLVKQSQHFAHQHMDEV
jgi:sarcosine oxidase subunit beta